MADGIQRQYASRIEGMTSFKVVDFLEAAVKMEAQGRDIVRMEAGEPAFPTAPAIVEAASAALHDEKTFYTPSLGIIELREAIAAFYDTRYGLRIPVQRIVVTTGSSAALGLICDLIINPGDGLQLTDPGYPCNANFVRRAGGEPQLIPVDAHNAYQLTPEAVAEHWRDNTVGVLVASPSNPTGEMLSRDNQRGINDVVASHNGVMIMDELYHGLVYDQRESSILEINNDAMVINSFSKYFGMTGWRLGWMVVPEDALEAVNIMAQNFYISPPSIAQYAALGLNRRLLKLWRPAAPNFASAGTILSPPCESLALAFPIHRQVPFIFMRVLKNWRRIAKPFAGICLSAPGWPLPRAPTSVNIWRASMCASLTPNRWTG